MKKAFQVILFPGEFVSALQELRASIYIPLAIEEDKDAVLDSVQVAIEGNPGRPWEKPKLGKYELEYTTHFRRNQLVLMMKVREKNPYNTQSLGRVDYANIKGLIMALSEQFYGAFGP